MAQESDCIFCGVVAGDVPATLIARTERAVAFMDINPVTHGHALVIPRAHATGLLDIAPDDLAACSHRDEPGKDAIGLPWKQQPGDPEQIRQIGRQLS